MIKIINGDCLEELSELPDCSIDCVITDPPYFIDGLDDKWSEHRATKRVPNSHITHLPKGMKYDKRQVKQLYAFYRKLSEILYKKMKPGAYFLSFSSPRLYHAIAMACELSGFEIRDMITWVYTQGMPKGMSMTHVIKRMKLEEAKRSELIKEYKDMKTPQLRSCFEPICVAMKPLEGTFMKNELRFKTGLIDFSQKVGTESNRIPANVVTSDLINPIYDKCFLVPKPNKKEKTAGNVHITVKPLKLMEHLVRIFSKPDSLVVDPFLGSGTTALACNRSGRNCIGIEINQRYCEIVQSRLG